MKKTAKYLLGVFILGVIFMNIFTLNVQVPKELDLKFLRLNFAEAEDPPAGDEINYPRFCITEEGKWGWETICKVGVIDCTPVDCTD